MKKLENVAFDFIKLEFDHNSSHLQVVSAVCKANFRSYLVNPKYKFIGIGIKSSRLSNLYIGILFSEIHFDYVRTESIY